MLSFSYGACATQIVLRDRPPGAKRFQGAAIPLPGYFYSGINHGAVNPKDGQIYVVGHDGWGSYAVADGCLVLATDDGTLWCFDAGQSSP